MRKPMTVADLRKLIADLADDTVVLVEGSDHSYLPASAAGVTAIRAGREFFEDFGDELVPGASRVTVLYVGA